jgi:16S rRNA G966 N2-methylase RsmD
MLDLFGGTGNHCYEFISRGCTNATYVDKHGPAVQFVKKMAKELDVEENLHIFKSDVFKFMRNNKKSYDYIFAGPPYPLKSLYRIPDILFQHKLLAPNGLFVLEHNPEHDFKDHACYIKERNYGQTIFAFFKNPS